MARRRRHAAWRRRRSDPARLDGRSAQGSTAAARGGSGTRLGDGGTQLCGAGARRDGTGARLDSDARLDNSARLDSGARLGAGAARRSRRKRLDCRNPSNLKFRGGKMAKLEDRYTLEITEDFLKRCDLPAREFQTKGKTKKCKRYMTEELSRLIDDLATAKARKDSCISDAARKVFARSVRA